MKGINSEVYAMREGAQVTPPPALALGESVPYKAGRGAIECPHDASRLIETARQREGQHEGTRTFVCLDGHVWLRAEGVDGIRAWQQVDATQRALL